MEKEALNKLSGHFEVDETFENENWIRTKIRTFAFGKNRNGSDIISSSLEEFGKARKSIGAIPIVARYNDVKDDLEGHNVIMRKNKDDEYEIYHDTDALGFTSPTANFYLEEVNEGTEMNPDYKTYITIDDVYLWKRFDATKKILEWKEEGIPAKVSMEIDNVEGQFDKEGYFSISDFIFTAIAALGSDVEPCFPKAEIQLYTVNDFKSDLKQLMYELTNQETVEQKGGNDLTQENNEQVETKEEFENVDTTETQVEVQADASQDFKTITEVTETTEVKTEVKTIEVEEDMENDMREDEVFDAESTESKFEEVATTTDEPVNTDETFEEEVKVETEPTDEPTEEFEEVQTQVEEVEATKESDDTNEAFAELTKEYEALKVEVEELRKFKRDSELNGLYSKFEGKLTKSELDNVFANNTDKSVSDIENLIFVEIGKKNFSLAQQEKQVKQPEIQMPRKTEEFSNGTYSTLIEKHINNLN